MLRPGALTLAGAPPEMLQQIMADPQTSPGQRIRAATELARRGQQSVSGPQVPQAMAPPQAVAPAQAANAHGQAPPIPPLQSMMPTGGGQMPFGEPDLTPPPQDLAQAAMAPGAAPNDPSAAIAAGAKQADDVLAPPPAMGGGAASPTGGKPWDSRFMDMVRDATAKVGDDDDLDDNDKGMALARLGFGMAASKSPHWGQALGEGGVGAIDQLQKMRSQRAEQRMRALAQNIGIAGTAAQLGAGEEARNMTQQQINRQIKADEDLRPLREAQTRAALAQAAASNALASTRTAASAPLPEGSGAAFLDQLPDNEQAIVKQVAEGRLLPTTLSARNGYRQRVLEAVAQYDPTFDQKEVNARFNTQKDFGTGGMSGKNITAANTLVRHLDELKTYGDKLGNVNTPVVGKVYNYVQQAAKSSGSNPELKSFNVAKQAVADEMEKVMRGSTGSLAGTQEWKKSFNNVSSPEELQAAVGTGITLMRDRLDELASNYNRNMGTEKTWKDFMSPEARKAIAKLAPEIVGAAAEEDEAPAIANVIDAEGDALVNKWLNQGAQ